MTRNTDLIQTSVEAAERAILPMFHEVHIDPTRTPVQAKDLPTTMQAPNGAKSAARWAYERLILYIQTFEKQLSKGEEVAMGFTGGEAGVIRIEGMGYFDPDILTFYGTDADGQKTQLIQHVGQLNVLLRAMPTAAEATEPTRIGFQLARDLETR